MVGFSTPSAQRDDKIEFYADQLMSSCSLVEDYSGIRSIYTFHTGSYGAMGSEFSAPMPACWTGASFLSWTPAGQFTAIGQLQTGVSIEYGSCLNPPIYLGHATVFVSAPAHGARCCWYGPSPSPLVSPAEILITDCLHQLQAANSGAEVVINPDATCPCTQPPPPPPPPPQRGDKIEVFADAQMVSCELLDNGFGIRSVHIFHTGPLAATGSQFVAPIPACWVGATWLGDTVAAPFLAIGNSQTDWTIVYTGCLQPPIYVARIDYFSTGASQSCCKYGVAPSPSASEPGVLAIDCNFANFVASNDVRVTINPSSECPCGSPALPVQSTTWGRVKAMYRSN